MDGSVDAGSFISFSFTVNPKQNFHVYDATNSYHQSPQMGEDFDNDGYSASGIGTVPDYTGSPALVDDESDLTVIPRGTGGKALKKAEPTLSDLNLLPILPFQLSALTEST